MKHITQDITRLRALNKVEEISGSSYRQMSGFFVARKNEKTRILTRSCTKKITKISRALVPVFVFISVFVVLFGGAHFAYAAGISFSPASGTYRVGDTFPVGIVVASPDQAVNAVSGRVLFSPSKLEVVHISKSASILDLWIAEPTYSNGAGTIDFEGIAFNPGYQGGSGQVILITFRVKDSGSIPLSFSSAFVLANDGRGTDVLKDIGSALFDIAGSAAPSAPKPASTAKPASNPNNPNNQNNPKPSAQEESVPERDPPVAAGTPNAPKVASLTHPKENWWYAGNSATFSWEMPKDVTAVRLLYGSQQYAAPTVEYNEPISEKTIENISEGTHYFHVQLKNAAGWGKIAHFRFRIDSTVPESLFVADEGRDNSAGPQYTYFSMRSEDALSGIERYEIMIDGTNREIRQGNIAAVWSAPRLRDGAHTLTVTAFDKAGNSVTENRSFEVLNTSFIMLGSLAFLDVGPALLVVATLLILAFMLGWLFHEMGGWIIFLPLFVLFRFAHRILRLEKRFRSAQKQKFYARKEIPKRRIQ